MELQKKIFEHIQNAIPKDYIMVNEIADLLNISVDSAYRRIRGDKAIEIQETALLCTHYKISLDAILQLSDNANPKILVA